jgi:P-type E1-E2 ATPase
MDIGEEFKKMYDILQRGSKLEVMISGMKLSQILQHDSAIDLVEKVLSLASAVIIYRAKPLDKANVVNFIRMRNRGKITLAIGDGANDVNMIQSAHIGVGIKGKEGNQASMFADYSIPEFRGLRRLIFWHGRNFSQRLTDFICLNVWKNMSISTALSFYNCFAGFSGLQQIE